MAQSGIDHGIQNVFARALKADILGAIGQHKQAASLIKSATDENARKRSVYIRRGINPLTLWLLEAHCELFSGDISYNQGRLGAYRIRHSQLNDTCRASILRLLDDRDSVRHMKAALTWYKKAIDTLENPFATGVTKSSRVAGIETGTAHNAGAAASGNGVSLRWDEILIEDSADIARRLSSKCLIGLARANVCSMLLEIKRLSQTERASHALQEPFATFGFPPDFSLTELVAHLEQACDIPCVLDKEGIADSGLALDGIRIHFTDDENGTLIDVLSAALGRAELVTFASERGFFILRAGTRAMQGASAVQIFRGPTA
jgi:hypothetical protein